MVGSEAQKTDRIVTVEDDECIRCAACSSIAPEIFQVVESGAYVVRQPVDDAEMSQCEVVVANCPMSAIKMSAAV